MKKLKNFMKKKDIVISAKRYGIDALGAMAQGLFCSLLIGTIINTLGTHSLIQSAVMPLQCQVLQWRLPLVLHCAARLWFYFP